MLVVGIWMTSLAWGVIGIWRALCAVCLDYLVAYLIVGGLVFGMFVVGNWTLGNLDFR